MILLLLSFFLILLIADTFEEDVALLQVAIIYIAGIWFQLSQGVKRCHDVGSSGWFILIPFYGLWLLFAEGEKWRNEWG